MDMLLQRCAGLDVHKDTVVVCVRRVQESGQVDSQVRTFATMTRSLLALADWLAKLEVTHVAMESTGVYWKPIYHLLEDHFKVLLVNAQHLKKVPGRKTDVKDCEWIAQLLQCGLLKGSFIPPEPIRDLRDLTRQRTQLIRERCRAANRVQKVLEDTNIKLASVASDVLGVSGLEMLRALIRGVTDPKELAELAKGRLRAKIPQLREALRGRVREHHRFLLQSHLDHVQALDQLIAGLTERIEVVLAPFAPTVALLDTIPGINEEAAQSIVAEIGVDMGQFPTDAALASWAGICSGNNESAGKRRSGKPAKGSPWLRRILLQCAWAASMTKNTYLRAQFQRLRRQRGDKRAIVAVAHTLLIICYHVIKDQAPYNELGGDYFDRQTPERLVNRLVRRLEQLGHEVTLKPKLAPNPAA